jgi:hypothetical protein
MYTNIPISETKYKISKILNNNNETPTIEKEELEILLNTIFEQNYSKTWL